MGWFDNNSDQAQAHDTVNASGHKAALSHELIAAAASFAAAQAYEKHVTANGKPASHAHAKEFIAAAAGAFIDHLVESKGLDFVDKEKAKHDAKKQAEAALAQSGDY